MRSSARKAVSTQPIRFLAVPRPLLQQARLGPAMLWDPDRCVVYRETSHLLTPQHNTLCAKQLRPFTLGIPLAMMAIALGASTFYKSRLAPDSAERHLAADEDCPSMASWEDGFAGGALHLFIMFYIFCALAIICDDYFCESLEKISDGLNLR